MGSELVTTAASPKTYKEIFDELCPHYMAMGLSYEEFWRGSPDLLRQCRRSFEIKRSQNNWSAWLQGLYNYNAICAAHPLFNPFAPKGTKAGDYIEEAIPITEKEVKAYEEKQKLKRFEKLKAYMTSRQNAINKRGENNVRSTD